MSIVKAEQKLSEIMSTQKELQEQSEEIRRLMAMEGEYEYLKEKAEIARRKVADLEMRLNSIDMQLPDSALQEAEYKKHLAYAKKELAELEKRAEEALRRKEALQYIVDNNKNFDKNKLFRNIRKLISSTGAKLGQIEKEAGCQPGYMSRLEKAGNTTDPSVEFVVTAAKELEVSLDLLIYGNMGNMTPTEMYILNFINKLIRDTKNDVVVWKANDLGKGFRIADVEKESKADIFQQFIESIDAATNSVRYRSLFFPDNKVVTCVGNCYVGDLSGSEAKMYIMSCLDPAAEEGVRQFYELYIVDNDKVNPLLCTAQTSEGLIPAVDQLFEAVEVSATHIHINGDVRTIIDLYLRR